MPGWIETDCNSQARVSRTFVADRFGTAAGAVLSSGCPSSQKLPRAYYTWDQIEHASEIRCDGDGGGGDGDAFSLLRSGILFLLGDSSESM